MRRPTLAAVAAWLLLLHSGSARAEDPKPPTPVDGNVAKVVELEKQAKQHLADHADDASKKDCKSALELAGTLADATLKTRCLEIIGLILEKTSEGSVRKAAIKAVADSGEKSLYHFVRPYLAQPNNKQVPERLMDAVECAGKLKADEAVQPMLDLEANSDVYTVNVAAIQALSNYGDAKRWRAKILRDLVTDVRQDRPGTPEDLDLPGIRRRRGREESRIRYEALSAEVVTACNKLTGRTVATPDEWFVLIEKHKADLDGLFGSR